MPTKKNGKKPTWYVEVLLRVRTNTKTKKPYLASKYVLTKGVRPKGNAKGFLNGVARRMEKGADKCIK